MSECLQAYIGLGYIYLVGLPLPHSGTECRAVILEQVTQFYNNVGYLFSLSVCVLAK